MKFESIHAATSAIRAFEAQHGCAGHYAYRFGTDCLGRLEVLIYGAESGALLGVL